MSDMLMFGLFIQVAFTTEIAIDSKLILLLDVDCQQDTSPLAEWAGIALDKLFEAAVRY